MKNLKFKKKSDRHLTRDEMKNIFGGLHELRPPDPYCDVLIDYEKKPNGCPCESHSECGTTRYTYNQETHTYSLYLHGYCTSGVCHD